MGRVFFPTYRHNILGVRDFGPYPQLGGMDGEIVVPRAPAEPYPRAANNPTGPMLGIYAPRRGDSFSPNGGDTYQWRPVRPQPVISAPSSTGPNVPVYSAGPGTITVVAPTAPPPGPSLPVRFLGPPVQAPGAPPAPVSAPPAVSAQGSPTPVVTLPAQAQPGAVLVSSGGGTAAPATAPITIQTGGDIASGIAAWLQGSTVLFNYTIPNAALAAGVILLFALFSKDSGRRR